MNIHGLFYLIATIIEVSTDWINLLLNTTLTKKQSVNFQTVSNVLDGALSSRKNKTIPGRKQKTVPLVEVNYKIVHVEQQ